MSIYAERKIDCHAHVLDPARFPYGADIAYRPSGQEIGASAQLREMMPAYGIEHTLLVQPNSGYGSDNRCMLDAVETSGGVIKGIAIVELDATLEELAALRQRGILGVAFNPTFRGSAYYADSGKLIARLAELDMFLNIQCERDQFLMFLPWIEATRVRVLVDHCGRPSPEQGIGQPAFKVLLRLAASGRVHVKLSGYLKFARTPYPFVDCWPFVEALLDAFTPERCLWASDWPYLRAAERQDVGPLLKLFERFVPAAADRQRIFWDTPARLLGFNG